MDYRGVLLLWFQLWSALAKSDCPKECNCVQAAFGGTVAHCDQLNVNQVFSNLIHHLNVTNSKVQYLENRLFLKIHLEDLQSIKIINSSLSLIDQHAFAGMDNLNFLDLSDNFLNYIRPDTFINNSNLQQLSLSGNFLSLSEAPSKPTYFLKSRTLTDLDLSKCQIRQITSKSFSELPNLINLNLASNYISFVSPEMFEKMEYLEEVDLSNNVLRDIDPMLFADIEDMTILKLSQNSLTKFDNVDIAALKELDLSSNIFKSLESSTLEGTPDVSIANFSHNQIERIHEDTFTDLNRLRYLDLSYNNLKGPLSQFIFETNEELETLSLRHNQNLTVFDGLSGNFNSLYKLDISYCGLTQLSENTFKNLQHISTLDLSGNKLTELNVHTFKKLTRLNNLDLSENQLTKLPEDLFEGNMDLRKLSIRGNRIHHLPAKLFQPTKHLSSFDASNCYLTYLWNQKESAYMKENEVLSQLTYFNLEGNRFATLHRHNFESMKSLKTLDITRNPFQCDEQFILLIEWLVQQKTTTARYIGKSSADLEQEHAGLHWSDMLSKICSTTINIIPKNKKYESIIDKEIKIQKQEDVINDVDEDIFKKEMNEVHYNSKLDPVNNIGQENDDKVFDPFVKHIPDIDYTSNFGLVPEPVIKSSVPNDSQYPWVWPLFLVLICGASILLALFNLAALLLYRNGKNNSNYSKVAGYRSTFIAPLSGHLKIRRDAGSFYHKLYEECSVPNTVPIVKQSDDLPKPAKKNTIVINGVTKGEDMV